MRLGGETLFNIKVGEIAAIRESVFCFTEYIRQKGGSESDIENSKLIAFELISNVLLHSKCPAALSARSIGGAMEITVESCGDCAGARQIYKPNLLNCRGRGLFIVKQLCSELKLYERKTVAVIFLNK